jgi:hypothetical protein
MSPINQINSLANGMPPNISPRPQVGRTASLESDWFTASSTENDLPITASQVFEEGSTVDEMSKSILSCIGDLP